MKIEKFLWEKVKLWKFSTECDHFSEIGEIWNRGEMHHCLRGDGRPWQYNSYWNVILTKKSIGRPRVVKMCHYEQSLVVYLRSLGKNVMSRSIHLFVR